METDAHGETGRFYYRQRFIVIVRPRPILTHTQKRRGTCDAAEKDE